MKDENGLTLILGGVRSGKSQYGEHMALDWHAKDAKNRELHYIATARNLDASMNQRILQHQNRRGDGWHNHEVPLYLADFIEQQSEKEKQGQQEKQPLLFIDCLSVWLTNIMVEMPKAEQAQSQFLLNAMKHTNSKMIIISSESNMGLIGEHEFVRHYQASIGILHQDIANLADRVILMVAGIPQIIKGKH